MSDADKIPTADNVLARIVEDQRQLLSAQRSIEDDAKIAERAQRACTEQPVRPFAKTLRTAQADARLPVIAEAKRASPSRGVIRACYDPAMIAQSYQQANAACLSVLTNNAFFQGEAQHLVAARAHCRLPILRKEFLLTPWQVDESRAIGADAVLLIAAILSAAQIDELATRAYHWGMSILFEVHHEEELRTVLSFIDGIDAEFRQQCLLGINNRDLNTFHTTIATTQSLVPLIRDAEGGDDLFVISESGINDPETVRTLADGGVDGFLIGESCMRATNPGAECARLFSLL